MSSYREELDKWLRQLDVSADNLLDIGGSQVNINGRTRTWDVKNYKIADLPNPHKDSEKPDIELDLNEEYEGFESFDLVFCLEVFEYIWNPAQAFENIAELLEEGGIAWITFPFFYPTHQPIEDDALRYTEFGIKKLAKHAGLEIDKIIPRRPYSNGLTATFNAERMRAAKGYDHSVTGWIVKFRKPL